MATCSKCGGTGHLAQYNHVMAGACFRCGGTGRDGGGMPRESPRALEVRKQQEIMRRVNDWRAAHGLPPSQELARQAAQSPRDRAAEAEWNTDYGWEFDLLIQAGTYTVEGANEHRAQYIANWKGPRA